jgi:hypothetical protein
MFGNRDYTAIYLALSAVLTCLNLLYQVEIFLYSSSPLTSREVPPIILVNLVEKYSGL